MYYNALDKRLKKLKTETKRIFSRYKAMIKFDEVNTLKLVKAMYKELDSLNKSAYLEIARDTYDMIYEGDKEDKSINKKWVNATLTDYDPVTKYVYENEVIRKQSRLFESLIASKNKFQDFALAFNLWWRQTSQYGITITDNAVVEAYKNMGYTHLVWNTQKDTRVCEKCKERDGKAYPIDNLPSKAHYGCRCYWTGVKK